VVNPAKGLERDPEFPELGDGITAEIPSGVQLP
jgi:hypothetical protein